MLQWSEQGVLLLNSVLTVRAASPASHQKRGWETFTDAVIRTLNARRQGIVYMLWGRYAQVRVGWGKSGFFWSPHRLGPCDSMQLHAGWCQCQRPS